MGTLVSSTKTQKNWLPWYNLNIVESGVKHYTLHDKNVEHL